MNSKSYEVLQSLKSYSKFLRNKIGQLNALLKIYNGFWMGLAGFYSHSNSFMGHSYIHSWTHKRLINLENCVRVSHNCITTAEAVRLAAEVKSQHKANHVLSDLMCEYINVQLRIKSNTALHTGSPSSQHTHTKKSSHLPTSSHFSQFLNLNILYKQRRGLAQLLM